MYYLYHCQTVQFNDIWGYLVGYVLTVVSRSVGCVSCHNH